MFASYCASKAPTISTASSSMFSIVKPFVFLGSLRNICRSLHKTSSIVFITFFSYFDVAKLCTPILLNATACVQKSVVRSKLGRTSEAANSRTTPISSFDFFTLFKTFKAFSNTTTERGESTEVMFPSRSTGLNRLGRIISSSMTTSKFVRFDAETIASAKKSASVEVKSSEVDARQHLAKPCAYVSASRSNAHFVLLSVLELSSSVFDSIMLCLKSILRFSDSKRLSSLSSDLISGISFVTANA